MKTIVAHMSPDLDAISSAWLLMRFMPGFSNAKIAFVPAGTTLEGKPADSDPNITHVDTGLGKYDHHQFKDSNMSAAKRVFLDLQAQKKLKKQDEDALERIIAFVVTIDNFREAYFHDPTSDIYDFGLDQIITSLKATGKNDSELMDIGFTILDGLLLHFKNKIRAEEEIKKGFDFKSRWGKTLAVETNNNETSRLALKGGYDLVIRKDPVRGHIRIHAFPKDELDLTPLHRALVAKEPDATWFLHISTHMLLNGSTKNPNSIASKLSLQQVIEIVKKM